MSQVNIVAILYPAEGKVDRVRELMGPMCQDVHDKEDYTYRYMMTEQLDKETPDIVMIETYKDKESAEKHTATSHFKELFGKFEKEGLMAKPPYLAQTVTKAGFDLDRKLV